MAFVAILLSVTALTMGKWGEVAKLPDPHTPNAMAQSLLLIAAVPAISPKFPYRSRDPTSGLTYRTLQNHLDEFFKLCRALDRILPKFVEQELLDYLNCGVLACGFHRIRCASCRVDKLLPFSCKRRGFCTSCTARRMNDLAAHLVDKVIPKVPTRQWVLSFPFGMRYLLAKDPKFLSFCHRIFTNEFQRYYADKAKELGFPSSKCGSVTFIQRWGGSLNLNIHLHCLSIDGIYFLGSHRPRFVKILPPNREEAGEILSRIRYKVCKEFEKKNTLSEFEADFEQASLAQKSLLIRQGKPIETISTIKESLQDSAGLYLRGFSMHWHTEIAAKQRLRLEKLLRYMGRGPYSEKRLSEDHQGYIYYRFKNPWHDGKTHLRMTPIEFIERLAALISPPRLNLLRYNGVFAANSKWRSLIVPAKVRAKKTDSQKVSPKERMRWADMLKRVFAIEALSCTQCGAKMEFIAVIEDPKVIKNILDHLGIPSQAPRLRKPTTRGPPLDSDFDYSQIPKDW